MRRARFIPPRTGERCVNALRVIFVPQVYAETLLTSFLMEGYQFPSRMQRGSGCS